MMAIAYAVFGDNERDRLFMEAIWASVLADNDRDRDRDRDRGRERGRDSITAISCKVFGDSDLDLDLRDAGADIADL